MSSKKIFIFAMLITVVVGFFCISNIALADDYGLDIVAQKSGLDAGGKDLPGVVGGILGTILSFIGVIFFALMVFGGFMWMTARGNDEQTKKAMGTITAAVIGLVIVLSSYAITSFVFKSAQIADLTEAPASGNQTSNVSERNKECNDALPGFTCNLITDCLNISAEAKELTTTSSTEDVKNICETKSGTKNCLTQKCKVGEDEKNPLVVCCKAIPESDKSDKWCLNLTTGKCEKLAAVGADSCPNDEAQKTLVIDGTEKKCYESLKGKPCTNSDYCNTSVTKFVCGAQGTCVEKATVEGTNKSCKSTDDCATGVCKDGQCKYVSPCPRNTKNAGTLTCSLVVCPSGHECTDDKQCGSDESGGKGGGFCVNGKCELGTEGASCKTDSQCASGNFCTTQGTPSCCLPKLDGGKNCFGMNNACKSGTCIDKAGFDVCN